MTFTVTPLTVILIAGATVCFLGCLGIGAWTLYLITRNFITLREQQAVLAGSVSNLASSMLKLDLRLGELEQELGLNALPDHGGSESSEGSQAGS